MNSTDIGLLVWAAYAAGAVNGVAGGGTVLTFSALLAVGLDPRVANATSTLAIWPGTLGAMTAGAVELKAGRPLLNRLWFPCLVGGVLGAWLLLRTTSGVFQGLVPWLILFATLLFAFQQGVQQASDRVMPFWLVAFFQFLVGVYSGYFGAASGILTLAALRFMGEHDLPKATAVKNFLGCLMNGIAVVVFIFAHLIDWKLALTMALAAIVGGYHGVKLARRIGPQRTRAFIIFVGVSVAAWTLYKNLLH